MKIRSGTRSGRSNVRHLLAGSNFAKRHISTVFKPFLIQELMTDAVFSPGPQLIFGIAPPGTGKTAIVPLSNM